MSVGVSEAARRLHVSERRVRALIESGLLDAEQVSGVHLVDDDSLDHLVLLDDRPHVRSFSRSIAWAAADLADGGGATFISATERSRLRSRLTHADRSTSAWVARLRGRAASTTRFRAGRDQLAGLLNDERVRLGGANASNAGGDRLISTDTAEVWVADTQQLEDLVRRWGLLRSRAGNVIVRCADVKGLNRLGDSVGGGDVSSDGGGSGRDAYRLVVAADLLDGSDSRSRSAGAHLLSAVLAEQRWRR